MGMYLFALIMIVLNVAAFAANSTAIPFRKELARTARGLGNKADDEEAPASV